MVFCGSKIKKWKEMFTDYKDPTEQKKVQMKYLLDLVAKMYLNGNA